MKLAYVVAVLASAAAAAARSVPLHEERVEVGVSILLCTGDNASGSCTRRDYPLGQCQLLTADLYQNTRTFVVESHDVECMPRLVNCDGTCMSPTGCTFGAVDDNYKHKWDLRAIGWDKYIQSFDCRMKTKA
ncbi:hypothetical protein E4U17_001929 [Claviceps sp. LM77 group G4]|nr:hypothetical protein E4U17_001929 [Claviceps sp. LM77 group G4]KAG6075610.1 hypothetical protein E4U33_002013 [Claviceps sp. LM78 group G4]KAG6077211.1 hypothetical protein E4U16_002366 [Claviceps sp. LM84 group G4]